MSARGDATAGIGTVVGIHHVQLACPPGDEDAARAFYGMLLGLTEIPKPPGLAGRGGVWFRGGPPPGGVEIHLGVEPDFQPARKAHPGLIVGGPDGPGPGEPGQPGQSDEPGGLEALAARLAEAGHRVDWDGELPGFHRCYVRDPHGNRIELLEPVPRPRR